MADKKRSYKDLDLTSRCSWCFRAVQPIPKESGTEMVPPPWSDDKWTELELGHKPECEWVATRAFQR